MIYYSQSTKQTKEFAKKLAKEVKRTKFSVGGAVVLALKGDLGSGKTTFTQGFAKGLGTKNKIISPTFLIFRRYKIYDSRLRNGQASFKFFYHVDCYRVKDIKELEVLKFKEILAEPKNIVLIEWPERISKILPKNRILINFSHIGEENERKIVIK